MIRFHFLNVGHGDTTIVELPDNRLMVVDFNRSNELDENTAEELSSIYGLNFEELKDKGTGYYSPISEYYDIALDDPLEYLSEHVPGQGIYRYVQTHPHMDHLGGLKSLTDNLPIAHFWDTDHSNVDKTVFQSDSDKQDWEHYLRFRKGKKVTFYRSGQSISAENEEYPYKIFVFHPTKAALLAGDSKDNSNPNLFSYLIVIDHNGFKAVLGGDVTCEYWKDLWNWLGENPESKKLFKDIHVLKASHHGRKSGRCAWEENGRIQRDFLNWMDPEYVIISVGKKPEQCDATDWYRRRPKDSNRQVLTTRWYGTVWVSYDGTIPFDRGRICLETRYDRKDASEHIQQLDIPFAETVHKFKIGAKRGLSEAGPFKEEYKTKGRALHKGLHLQFYVRKTNIPEPFEVKWRVVNTGREAREAEDSRGKIIHDNGSKTRRERTKYRGTHYMDCFAIKDGVCVAKDRLYVNIK